VMDGDNDENEKHKAYQHHHHHHRYQKQLLLLLLLSLTDLPGVAYIPRGSRVYRSVAPDSSLLVHQDLRIIHRALCIAIVDTCT